MFTFRKFSLLLCFLSLQSAYASDAQRACEESKFFLGNDERVFKEYKENKEFYACSTLAPTANGSEELLLILENKSTSDLECEVDFQIRQRCTAFGPSQKSQQKLFLNAQQNIELALASSEIACNHSLQISCKPETCVEANARFVSDEPYLSEIKLAGQICMGKLEETTCKEGKKTTKLIDYKGIYSLSSEKNELFCEQADLCFIGVDAYRVGELFSIEENSCTESFECLPGGELLSLARECR